MTYLNKICTNLYLLCAIGIIFSFGNANAQSEKVMIDPTTITVDESASYQISFNLQSPIVCADPHALCDVVILLTNPSPNEMNGNNLNR